MSYLVLARKWRPSTFAEVVGQGHVTRTLENAIELNRVAHALLFTGSRGVGKTTCARILAKALNCVHGPTTTPCGECPACVEISNGTSVDVFEIDGASNNSVEQIREIRESVKFMPTRGKRKMYIIDEVHMLSTSAFNALLKTLEEPPAHVLFVFATTEPHKIPDTILSRCQRYDFKRIAEREIVDAVGQIAAAEGVDVDAASLHHIARESRGGMRDSLSLLDQVIAFCGTTIREAQTREVLGIADRQVLYDLTAAVLDGDGQRALDVVDRLFRFGLDLQKFAAEFVQHLRDLMVVRVCAHAERLVDVPAEELGAMVKLVADVDPARIHRLFNALLQGADEASRSPFPKLVFEMTLLRLCHQGPTLPLAEVLSGLARLEARLDAEVPASSGPTGSPAGPASGGFSGNPAGGGLSGGGFSGNPAGGGLQAAPAPRAVEAPVFEAARPAEPAPAMPARANPPPPAPAPISRPAPSAARPAEARPASTPAVERPVEARPSGPPARVPASRNDGNDRRGPAEPRVFRRRPAAEDGEVDDFSATPPAPLPPERLPVLAVKPRPPGVEPGEFPPGEGEGAPPASPGDSGPASDPGHSGLAFSPADEDDAAIDAQPARIDLTAGAPLDHFARLVEAVRADEPFLASKIEHDVHLLALDAASLDVALDAPPERVEETRAALQRVVGRLLSPSAIVRVQSVPRGDARLSGPTLYERRQALEAADRKARKEKARFDPMVTLAVDVLGASIAEIHPL